MIIKSSRRILFLAGTLVAMAALVQPAAAQSGAASWYGCGSRTANGERFNPNGMTAAHRSLPFGTRVLVHNTGNGRSVVVRINDRGPFVRGRIIDLARGSARALGIGGVSPRRPGRRRLSGMASAGVVHCAGRHHVRWPVARSGIAMRNR